MKWLGILTLGLVALIIIVAVSSSGDDKNTSNGGSGDEAAEESSEKTGPLVKGTWDGDCNQFSAGDESACEALKGSNVTCQWVEDNVRMKITFANGLAAHVTVHLEPRYTLRDAGAHGEGITNTEDVGLDSKATRTWETDLDPAGVDDTQPVITKCNPRLDVLGGVELG